MSSLDNISDLTAQLADLDAAIKAAVTGQAYSIGGRSVTRQDLPTLRDHRTYLQRRLTQTRNALEGARSSGVSIASWHR